jgi:hypothetical protein
MSIHYRLQSGIQNTFFLGAFLLILTLASSVLLSSNQASAAPGKINYQGRLTDAAGAAKPDGQYNMKFRIYDTLSGGSVIWSEVRETTSRVTVTNGQFNVQLGDVTPIPPSAFASDTRYFEIELPTPATATCSTAACGTYTEGAMTPRQPVASSAYALTAEDSDTLDGLDSMAFAQVSSTNTFTGTNLFKNTTNSSTAFGVQRADSTSLFNINTSTSAVSIGQGGASPVFGKVTTGIGIDSTTGGKVAMSRYQTGLNVGAVSEISLHINTVLDSPNDKYQLAIYSDSAGVPGALLATTAEQIIASGWSTVAITGATLSPSTNYWLAYITSSIDGSKNRMSYDSTGNGCSFIQAYASGFPANAPACATMTRTYSMNVRFASTAPAMTVASYGKVGIGTSTPSATLDLLGDATFKSLSDSSTAFQIQASSATTLFVIDTVRSSVQIGSTAVDDVATVLILDAKSTSVDPVGAPAGSMYYNTALNKFRCYEGTSWKNCISVVDAAVYRAASDVSNSTITYATATGLSFSASNGVQYNFRATIRFDAAATTTGVRFGLTGPTLNAMSMVGEVPLTATSSWPIYSNAYDTGTVSATSAFTAGNIATIEGTIVTSGNGTVSIRFASEVAASAITVKAGSTLTVW